MGEKDDVVAMDDADVLSGKPSELGEPESEQLQFGQSAQGDCAAAHEGDGAPGDAMWGPNEDMNAEEAFLLQMLSADELEELKTAQQKHEAEQDTSGLSPDELQAKAEYDALLAAFSLVRERSNAGKLTTPGTWAAESVVPDHMAPVDFCDIAFDVIIAAQAESAEQAEAAQNAASHENADAQIQDVCSGAEADGAEGMTVDAAVAPDHDTDEFAHYWENPAWELDDIKVLEGKQSYLYSSNFMTDTYAHWAFLAEEGDDALTLVDNARNESRLYPRPMLAESLMNKPYYMTREQIDAAWASVQESGTYPDVKTCAASNGDVYYYSTDYLSDAQAKALAEWYSVERYMNV